MNALPLQFLMLIFAGWVNRHQQDVIEYLQEENRALREHLAGRRLRFTDQQRRSDHAVGVDNAYAERFVRSIKSECLARIIPLGEDHLRHMVKEYTEHCHVERNHQGLDNRLIEKPQVVVDLKSAVMRNERLGGVLNDYERRAA